MAAEPQGNSAESSNLGLHPARDFQPRRGNCLPRRPDREGEEAQRDLQGATRDPRVFGLG